jgi:hypothetical protein
VREAGEDGAAGGVGERGEGGIEWGGGTVNHTVYYCRVRRECQGFICFWNAEQGFHHRGHREHGEDGGARKTAGREAKGSGPA